MPPRRRRSAPARVPRRGGGRPWRQRAARGRHTGEEGSSCGGFYGSVVRSHTQSRRPRRAMCDIIASICGRRTAGTTSASRRSARTSMANTPKPDPDQIERRDFLKKTGTVAGALAAGFPGIISGQTVTNALKIGLVGCGGRGNGAAGQALTAHKDNELTSLADIDDQIVELAATRL